MLLSLSYFSIHSKEGWLDVEGSIEGRLDVEGWLDVEGTLDVEGWNDGLAEGQSMAPHCSWEASITDTEM